MVEAANPMISIDRITSLYPSTGKGLRDFSCEFLPGAYALLGKNGSGKTTLFRNLIGAIFPQKGSCQILGEPSGVRNPDLLKDIFLIPDEPFFPNVKTKDYIQGMAPFYPHFHNGILQDLTDRWEIPWDSGLRQMSQGQKKKFLIAFALATQARIMLFDEPTNGLDIVSKISFKRLCSELLHPHQLFIFATHQIKDVETLIGHITLIEEGKCWGTYSLKTLQEKFITEENKKEDPQVLYCLPSQDRYLVLKERKRQKPSLDLEIFFTSFHHNPEKIQGILAS